jgi:hypothetical protein
LDELSTIEALHLVEALAKLSVREFTQIGREASLREAFSDVARAIH